MSLSSQYRLDIILTGVCPPSGQAELRVPGLELLLARGQTAASEPTAVEALAFGALGAEFEGGDLPVAAVTRLYDMGVADNEWWIRADPVHLVTRRDGLILVPGDLVDLELNEAQALCEELARNYAAEGWLLRAPHPWRWYLRPPQVPDIQTTPLSLVAGRDIHACLPTGPEGRAWHTLLNEMQILLHSSQINAERERRGALAINSLWFWGGGRLPAVKGAGVDAVWSDEVVALALARLMGVPHNPLPAGYGAWKSLARPGHHLIVFDGLRKAIQRDAEAGWGIGLAELETAWFGPLVAAMRAGEVSELTLLTDHGLTCQTTGWQLRRWWRRRRPLSDFTPHSPVSA